jgi:imidazolonepropionase
MDRGAAVAATMATATGSLPARGRGSAARVSERSGVAWDETGTIVYTGRADAIPWPATIGDPGRGCLVPGFVDCHVHLPFYGWRAAEFEARVRGTSYAELHRSEGGIFSSSRLLNAAGDDEVIRFCKPLLEEMLAHGTTALELKTGYGLGLEAELRQARLARRLAEEVEQTCTVTLLACHAIPEGVSRQDWVRTACGELIPSAAAEGLVDAVDIYVEDIAFTLDDLEAVAEAAGEAGLPLRVHADQLGPTGATTAAVRLGARSADHLNHCGDDGVAALGSATATVAGLLPASSFFLGAGLPPARAIRDAGAAVAVATDFNPGTSPTCSMPETIAMAATLYGLPPLEALTAATANPAWVLGLDERLGTLEVGKRADLLLLEEPSFAQVPYRPGHNPVTAVVVGGRLASAAHPGP